MTEELDIARKILHNLEIERGTPVGELEHDWNALLSITATLIPLAEKIRDAAYADGHQDGEADAEMNAEVYCPECSCVRCKAK